MTSDQLDAFEAGAGGKFTAGDVSFLLAGILASVVIAWFAWVAIRTYRGFADGDLKAADAGGLVLRGVLILTVLLYLIK